MRTVLEFKGERHEMKAIGHGGKRAGSSCKPGNPALLMRLPENVGAALAKEAKASKRTAQAVILGVLADHYGIEVDAPKRGGKKVEE